MKLHIGCGKNYIPGWCNTDLDSKVADMKLDARLRFQFPDNSVDYIFNEHFIEHLTQEEGRAFFCECYRVLKPRGVLRISTPDLSHVVNTYLNNDFKVSWAKTPCEFLNAAMHKWGHKFLYDSNQLYSQLKSVGFFGACEEEYRISDFKALCNLECRPYNNELIYEAIK